MPESPTFKGYAKAQAKGSFTTQLEMMEITIGGLVFPAPFKQARAIFPGELKSIARLTQIKKALPALMVPGVGSINATSGFAQSIKNKDTKN